MSRWVYLLGMGLALVALALAVTDRLLYAPGLTEANLRRLKRGMTLREVEAILGRPAGAENHIEWPPPEFWTRSWATETHAFIVVFDSNNRVVSVGFGSFDCNHEWHAQSWEAPTVQDNPVARFVAGLGL